MVDREKIKSTLYLDGSAQLLSILRKLPYDPSYISFITTVTKGRQPIFRDAKLAERLGTMIHMGCRQKGFTPLAYAILPDHLHLLVCSTILTRGLESPRSTSGGIDWTNKNTQSVEGGLFPFQINTTVDGIPPPGGASPPVPTIGDLMKSIKGTFSRTLIPGSIWQAGYFNWYINDPRDLYRRVAYVMYSYQKTGLPDMFGREPYVWQDAEHLPTLLS